MIFTPINLSVGAKKEGDDSILTGTWNRVFKWKPPEENTIDFLVKFVDKIDMDVSGVVKNYMYCKKIVYPAKKEMDLHKQYLKSSLKKNFF